MCNTAVFYGKELARYGFGESHPFGNDRLDAFWTVFRKECLQNAGSANGSGRHFADSIRIEQPALATDDKDSPLCGFHGRNYIEFVRKSSVAGTGYLDRGDTPAFTGVYEAGLYVVGTTLSALDMVMTGRDSMGNKIEHAMNPIGGLHHARRDAAGGFCVFNDIGVAIIAARKKYGVKKIAYVDIDAHHGDGVFYEFEDDPLVIFADIHEDGRYLYPGTGFPGEIGRGAAEGTKLNIPLEPGAGDEEFSAAFAAVEQFVDAAEPELIILQSGADGLDGDPITHLKYSSKSHRLAADSLHRLAHRHCAGRIIALGGGGYNRANIGYAWTEVVKSLAGPPV
ncbi:MAG: acetoin utilization protein AcuC [Nitrososphaera sp.]|jgi:acetoin utilization protein AcuC